MPRKSVIGGCLLCGLAAAAAAPAPAPAQLASPGISFGVGGPDTGGTGSARQLQLQQPLGNWRMFARLGLGSASAQAELGGFRHFAGGHEVGAFVDLRHTRGTQPPLRELSAYAAARAGTWRYQLSLTRDLDVPRGDMAVRIRISTSF